MAAVLACGPGALLSHRAAAALHELRAAPGGLIDVTARSRADHHRHPRSHQPAGSAATAIDGIPVTTLERTLLDYAAAHDRRRLDLRSTPPSAPGGSTRARSTPRSPPPPGHPGTGRLRAALAARTDEAPWTQSELERRFLTLVSDAGLPTPRTNVFVDDVLVDFYWPEAELIVEVDSFTTHRAPARASSATAQRHVQRARPAAATIRPDLPAGSTAGPARAAARRSAG